MPEAVHPKHDAHGNEGLRHKHLKIKNRRRVPQVHFMNLVLGFDVDFFSDRLFS